LIEDFLVVVVLIICLELHFLNSEERGVPDLLKDI